MKDLKIKYPLMIKSMVSIGALFFLNLRYLIDGNQVEVIHIILAIVLGSILVFSLVRSSLKPKTLSIHEQFIKIENKIICAEELKCIYIDRSNIIGIKPRNKKITPLALTIKTIGDSEHKFIINWAEDNKVQIKYQTFFKWI